MSGYRWLALKRAFSRTCQDDALLTIGRQRVVDATERDAVSLRGSAEHRVFDRVGVVEAILLVLEIEVEHLQNQARAVQAVQVTQRGRELLSMRGREERDSRKKKHVLRHEVLRLCYKLRE